LTAPGSTKIFDPDPSLLNLKYFVADSKQVYLVMQKSEMLAKISTEINFIFIFQIFKHLML